VSVTFSLELALVYSKKWVAQLENIEAVLAEYLSEQRPTVYKVADTLGTNHQNVMQVLKEQLPLEKRKAEKALRLSRGKVGHLNPMQGRSGFLHPNYIGSVEDRKGYLTEPDGRGKRVFQHRLVMAQVLGLETLPPHLDVHHIDGDTRNNNLDNLALVTKKGHAALHKRRPSWSRLSLWDQWESGISRSKVTTPMPYTDS
jgi:hypothetical protein